MSESLQDRVAAAVGGQYEIEGEIGRGGMSVVYRARDRRLNRTVAIKVLPPELAHDSAIRTRFTREAQMSAQLAHPHIVPIYDVGENEGLAYFVMAFVNGGNLAALLTREPRQPIEETRRLLCEIADALAYAHLRGVIHRDIKPDNILLDESSGRVMVTDFGIARAIEVSTRLTMTGIAVGTPAYMSPEQAVGDREIDGRSDVYSLGVIGYQMLSGRLPFSAGNSMALLLKHVSEAARPISELRPDAPKSLRETIERAMMKSAEDRWPTAAAMREALSGDRTGPPTWRADNREPVRYTSPRPDGARAEIRSASPRRGSQTPEPRQQAAPAEKPPNGIVLEAEHLASLTPAQRDDLRLWHGRVNLLDRVKAMRGYAVITFGAFCLAMAGLAGVENVPPLVLGPVIPLYMTVKLWRRGRSLRLSGLRLRRVLLMPRARHAIPQPARDPSGQQLEKLAPREVIESPFGSAIRRAVDDHAAILALAAKLPKEQRSHLKDLEPTVDALVARVASVAQALYRLDQSIDPRLVDDLEMRIASAHSDSSPEGERRLALLRRQRATFDDILQRRAVLARQLENAGLTLGGLRLDLIKFGSSGLQSALLDMSTATQEARALSREIGLVLDAAAEVEKL